MKTLCALLSVLSLAPGFSWAINPSPYSGSPPKSPQSLEREKEDLTAPLLREDLTGGALDENPVYNLGKEPTPFFNEQGQECEILNGQVECAPLKNPEDRRSGRMSDDCNCDCPGMGD